MSENPHQSQFSLPFAALIVGAIAMGASPIFVRLADVGPFASAFWRMALAIPILWGWLKYEAAYASKNGGSVHVLNASTDAKIIILIGFLFAGDLFFWHLSILNTSIANSTLLATTTTIVVAFGAWLFLKEKITRPIMIGVILSLFGAGLLVGASATYAPENVLGDVSGLITAGFFGAYLLSLAYARRRMSAAQVIFYPTIVSSGFLLIAAVLLDDRLFPHTLQGVAALGALALISQIAGQGLAAYAVGHLPAVFTSLVLFFEVLTAALLAWLIFEEPLSVWQLGGGLFILTGIFVARPRKRKLQKRS